MSVIFVDTETTGLEPQLHELWEIALIEENGREHVFYREPIALHNSDPTALRISGFYDRVRDTQRPISTGGIHGFNTDELSKDAMLAGQIATLTAGKHLVGAVPSFDARFLEMFMRINGFAPAWHYHLVDVEALVAGQLGIRPPWNSHELARQIGVPELDGKHSALGDARWAKLMYEAVFERVLSSARR
jgi:DNA polymerase III epsilon subunit-like protein